MFTPENLLEIRELYSLSQGDLALNLGISREVVNKMEKGRSAVSKRTAARLQKFLQTAENRYQHSDVNILGKSSHQPQKKTMPQNFQHQLLEGKNLAKVYLVPLVGIKAQAGYIKGFEEVDYVETLEQYSLPPGVNPTGAVWRYFEIDGDSMDPTFSSGDVILATMVPHEDWNDVKDFCVYIILTADQLLVKRLYKKGVNEWVLISDNEEVAPQKLMNTEDVKQLWLMRRHIRSKAPIPKEFKITA